MNTKIVVGLDGSDAGIAALRWAAHEAELRDAQLDIVHVWQVDPSAAMAGFPVPWQEVEGEIRAQASAWVAEAIGPLGDTERRRELRVVSGMPGPMLVDAAHQADMLVIGTQVHKGLSRMFQGSVSHYCLTHTTTVVVAVPARVDTPDPGT